MRYSLLLWPGFARAWYRGELYSTMVAILFAAVFCLVWIATFQWTEWFAPTIRASGWGILCVSALWSCFRGIRHWHQLFGEPASSPKRQNDDEAFRAAQQAYLRGEYFEAEAELHPIFARGAEDVESALLLVGILRRTQRVAQAINTLDKLSKLDDAAIWAVEIRRERTLCQRLLG